MPMFLFVKVHIGDQQSHARPVGWGHDGVYLTTSFNRRKETGA
jgi:hypothetical protein